MRVQDGILFCDRCEGSVILAKAVHHSVGPPPQWVCNSCRGDTDPGIFLITGYCDNCGQILTWSTVPKDRRDECPRCQHAVRVPWELPCPKCGKRLVLREVDAGRRISCPYCKAHIKGSGPRKHVRLTWPATLGKAQWMQLICLHCGELVLAEDVDLGSHGTCSGCGRGLVFPADSFILHTKIRGITHRNQDPERSERQKIAAASSAGERLFLLRQPNNPHDPNAVAIVNEASEQLGYLSRDLAASMAPHLDAGLPVAVEISDVTGEEIGTIGINLAIVVYGDKDFGRGT